MTRDPVVSGIGAAQLKAGKDQTVGTVAVLGTAAALPVVAAGATELATSGAAASFGAAALETVKGAASAAGTAIVTAGTATVAAAAKVADVASDLYAKAGALVTAAENAPGMFGKVINYAIGLGKDYLNSQAKATIGSKLKETGDPSINRGAQAAGILAGNAIRAAKSLLGGD